jgi:hypothetical protein
MAPSPTRSNPANRPASSVSKTSGGAMPTSARHGMSCEAACSTHGASCSTLLSNDRSGQPIGSMRAVPDPSRRSCTR